MDEELDLIFNNYIDEENKFIKYNENIQIIYLCMYTIYYHILVYFYFLHFYIFQSQNDHKFKIKIK